LTRIKICGVTEVFQAIAAMKAGADLIGLVFFPPSHRLITYEKAREIVTAVKKEKQSLLTVGVFVNTPAATVNEVGSFCGLDIVQLSGDETWAYCQQIERPVIKAIRIAQGWGKDDLLSCLEIGRQIPYPHPLMYLLDSQVKDMYGGAGVTFDWSLTREATARFPVIIAGGLTPENVAQAIEMVAPWGVDVSSGVETDRVKDITKIRDFIEAVRRTDASKT